MTSAATRPSALWWPRLRPLATAPAGRLLLLPHSGAGANGLRSLAGLVPQAVEVRGLSLPGRERRSAEQPGATVDDVLGSWLGEDLGDGVPTVVVGHSLGALLALQVARLAGSQCVGLLVSGHLPEPLDGRASRDAVTEEDVLRLHSAGGTPRVLLDDPELRRLIDRALRADIRLGREAGERARETVVDTPLLAVTGVDDPFAHPAGLAGWQRHTTHRLMSRTLPGGHFALLDTRNVPVVAHLLTEVGATHASAPNAVPHGLRIASGGESGTGE